VYPRRVVLLVLVFCAALPAASAAAGKACNDDSDCGKGEVCSLSNLCAVGCRTNSQCGPGELCLNNRCTSRFCNPGESDRCYDGPSQTRNVGPCSDGIRFCRPEGKFSTCYGQVLPQREVCDNEDNDCNGYLDDNITCDCIAGQRQQCYRYAEGTINVGECKPGIQYCISGNFWTKCYGEQGPETEVCDGKDNDCDGQVDEGIRCECAPGTIRACYTYAPATRDVGECAGGLQVCGPDHVWDARCFEQKVPRTEVCDNKDNDCDGTVDEGCLQPAIRMLEQPVPLEPKRLPGTIP